MFGVWVGFGVGVRRGKHAPTRGRPSGKAFAAQRSHCEKFRDREIYSCGRPSAPRSFTRWGNFGAAWGNSGPTKALQSTNKLPKPLCFSVLKSTGGFRGAELSPHGEISWGRDFPTRLNFAATKGSQLGQGCGQHLPIGTMSAGRFPTIVNNSGPPLSQLWEHRDYGSPPASHQIPLRAQSARGSTPPPHTPNPTHHARHSHPPRPNQGRTLEGGSQRAVSSLAPPEWAAATPKRLGSDQVYRVRIRIWALHGGPKLNVDFPKHEPPKGLGSDQVYRVRVRIWTLHGGPKLKVDFPEHEPS